MQCRFCKTELSNIFIDLVNSPASNSFLTREQLNEPELYFPLKVFTCHNCFLVQVDEYKKSDTIFNNDYAYFSSYSNSWLAHARDYVKKMTHRFGLGSKSLVVELASNDGYLLQYFNEYNVPVLGVEPTSNTAQVAIEKGIPTVVDFFGRRLAALLASENKKADLLLGNNVLAHVPDILDFVGGMKMLLKETGVITMEFPHLLQLVQNNQFDTIYHEHFSYLSFGTVQEIFESVGLRLFDVEELPTHGGSLRIFATHIDNNLLPEDVRVRQLLRKEEEAGLRKLDFYQGFQSQALKVKIDLLKFLVEQKELNNSVVAYGAAAKGNTLLNYCGVKNDLIEYVVDANPHKQGKWLPASHIPVVDESFIRASKPKFVLILPWNLKDEIIEQLEYVRLWGGKFVIPIPALQIL